MDMQNVQKNGEFEAFISLIEEGPVDSWELVAETLGVHRNTILKWKQIPEAKKALAKGLNFAIKQMENTGRRDWRMWREKVALLRRENELKQEGQSLITNNVLIVGDDQLAKLLHGFTKKLTESPAPMIEGEQK